MKGRTSYKWQAKEARDIDNDINNKINNNKINNKILNTIDIVHLNRLNAHKLYDK